MSNVFKTKAVRRGLVGAIAAAGAGALIIPTLPALAESQADAQPAKKTCEITVLDEGKSRASAIDSSGSWILGMNYNANKVATMWNDGEAVDHPVENPSEPWNGGVNSSGAAVGSDFISTINARTAWGAEAGGELVELELADDESDTVLANDINDDGIVIGISMNKPNLTVNALVWPSIEDEPLILERPEDSQAASAKSINEDGTIVGFVRDADGVTRPWVWDTDGSGEMLPGGEDISATATDVAGDFIVGSNTETNEVLIWKPNSDDVEVIDGLDTVAGVSSSGEVVGSKDLLNTLITSEGEPVQLPGLVNHDGSKDEFTAGINEDGTVVTGTAVDEDGLEHLVQWDCA